MKSRGISASLAAAAAIAGIAAFCAARAEGPITDSQGRPVPAAAAEQILSIGGDITEILYALGAGARIVAVDTTSQAPPEALTEKKSVGYMRALSTEGVLSVGASLIIAADRAGPPEVIKALKSMSIPYVEVAEHFEPAGVIGKVRLVSRIVGLERAGEALAVRLEQQFAALAETRSAIKKPVRTLFVFNVVNGRATVGGSGSSADAILKLAGAENAAAAVNGFKPLSDEAIVEMQPEAIVTMRRSSKAHDTDQLLAMNGMSGTPAAKANRVITMDGYYLLGFGPRTPAAALDLMRAIYPELHVKRAQLAK